MTAPAAVDRLVGRRDELARLAELHRAARLVTLHGPGGAGKTRLAMEYAQRVDAAQPGTARWVELASVTDAALLTQTVATALGVGEETGRSLLDAVASALTGRRALLVLDNCEHLVDAGARLAGALLTRCPDLTVLATSREILDIPGEAVLRLGALSLPEPGVPTDAVLRSDAVQLFVERAGAVTRDFALTDRNAAEVAGICTRLDGNALAIELAARRVRILAPAEILRRLDDRFQLLTGRRSGTDRHRDLHAAIGWSYELLDDREKALFRRVSVLAGGFGLDGALAASGSGDPAGVLDLVTSLEAKSLLVAVNGTGRFRQLESIRFFAYEQLVAAGEVAATRDRVVDWLAATAETLMRQPFPTLDVLGPLDAERDNLVAALGWEPDRRLPLTVALAACWRERGLFGRGRALLDTALSQADCVDPYRSAALAQAANLATDVGDGERARSLAAVAVALDERALETATAAIPSTESTVDDTSAALIRSTSRLSGACLAAGDAVAALRHARRALELARARPGDPLAAAMCQHNVAYIALYSGELDEAATLLAECLPYCRTRAEPWLRIGTLHSAGTVALDLADLDAAEAYFREAIGFAATHLARKFHSIEGLAVVAARRGDHERAVRLGAATSALRRGWGINPRDPWELRVAAALEAARTGLGEAASRRASAAGAAMSAADTESYALSGDPPSNPLTVREREIAELVAAGLSTREIAVKLGIAERTVDAHLDNIRSKLDLRSRTQVASWWTRHRLDGR